MVVAQLLERSRTLPVADGQLQGRLVKLESTLRRVAAAGGRAGGDEHRKGAMSHLLERGGLLRPGEVRALAEEGGLIVVGDQLEERLVASRRQSLQPPGDTGVRRRSSSE